jgi:hypothetical protein
MSRPLIDITKKTDEAKGLTQKRYVLFQLKASEPVAYLLVKEISNKED